MAKMRIQRLYKSKIEGRKTTVSLLSKVQSSEVTEKNVTGHVTDFLRMWQSLLN